MSPFEVLVPITAILVVIGLPVVGLVTRYALRPLVHDVAAAIRGGRDERAEKLAERVARLEERLEEQDKQLDRLLEAERFRQALESGEANLSP